VSLPGLLIVTIFGGSLAWRTGSPAFKRLYLVLLGGVALHACYWLALSLGMPRYIFIGVILLSALVAIPYLALEGAAPTLLYSGVLVLGRLGTVEGLQWPMGDLGGAWSAPSASNQESVVRFLGARADRRPFVGQSWASVADFEYLSKEVRDFKGYAAVAPEDLARGVLVVINNRFHDASDKQFSSFVARCGRPVFVAPPTPSTNAAARTRRAGHRPASRTPTVDAPDLFEKAQHVSKIRFEVVPLGPLVPGVDEHQAVVEGLVNHRRDEALQASSERLRCVVHDDYALGAPSRGIVPAHEDARMNWESRSVLIHQSSRFLVVVDFQRRTSDAQEQVSAEFPPGWCVVECLRQSPELWLEADRAVEPEMATVGASAMAVDA
jgi:hypothetical protein